MNNSERISFTYENNFSDVIAETKVGYRVSKFTLPGLHLGFGR